MENKFRVLLAEKKLKIVDIHKMTGIARSTLINIYHERSENPDSQTLIKIAKCLEVGLDELLGWNK